MQNTYLNWLLENTPTTWWHDSAEAVELEVGLSRGAVGVTTNPFLSNIALAKGRSRWGAEIDEVLARNLPGEQKAEALMRIAVTKTTEKVRGHVCAQVNPLRAGERDFFGRAGVHDAVVDPAVRDEDLDAGLRILEQSLRDVASTTTQ